ncbi:MAG: acetylxylan esterase [Pirellulales bacterium]
MQVQDRESAWLWTLQARIATLAIGSAVLGLSCGILRADEPVGRAADAAGPVADADSRLGELRSLDTHSPFSPPATLGDWRERAAALRQQLQVNLGLWPMPTRLPLEPVIHGRRELDGYSLEKVYFESLPGFFVTGNLYRPLGQSGKRPAVLCPHGHWSQGRFYDAGEEATAKEIATGGELFPDGGRNPVQARCVHLARMGCVVFIYDMIGYADSVQIGEDVAHRYAQRRPDMETPERWGLFSPRAELHQQHVMGLQSFNSIRALDFLCSLPDVDTSRIGVTGASGGGTQTFILAALDGRPRAVFPAVMVSTGMQGGCTCENACGVRTTTGNVEIAALAAPRPQGLTAANDWTKEMDHDGMPQLQQIYRLFDRPDHVHLTSLLQYGHNYNAPSRAAMYAWMNRHLALGYDHVPAETEYQRQTREDLTVWDAQHPQPPSGPETERRVLEWWHQDARQQLQPPPSDDAAEWAHYQQKLRTAWQGLVKRTAPEQVRLSWIAEPTQKVAEVAGAERLDAIAQWRPAADQVERLPVSWLRPLGKIRGSVVWLDERGRDGLKSKDGSLAVPVQQLLRHGIAVLGVDLIGQGAQADPRETADLAPLVDTPRQFAGYTFGYNFPRYVQRTHDVMTAVSLARRLAGPEVQVGVVGLGGAGRWAVTAQAADPGLARALAVDLNGFTVSRVADWSHPDFMPGAGKYGDMAGMLVAAAPARLWVDGLDDTSVAAVRNAYQGLRQSDRLKQDDLSGNAAGEGLAAWIAEQLTAKDRAG